MLMKSAHEKENEKAVQQGKQPRKDVASVRFSFSLYSEGTPHLEWQSVIEQKLHPRGMSNWGYSWEDQTAPSPRKSTSEQVSGMTCWEMETRLPTESISSSYFIRHTPAYMKTKYTAPRYNFLLDFDWSQFLRKHTEVGQIVGQTTILNVIFGMGIVVTHHLSPPKFILKCPPLWLAFLRVLLAFMMHDPHQVQD